MSPNFEGSSSLIGQLSAVWVSNSDANSGSETMPRSGKSDSQQDLIAIRNGSLLVSNGPEKRFYIPRRFRFALRFFEFALGMFCLFLLGLQDATLLGQHDLTSVVSLSWTASFIALGILVWQSSLYIVPMCVTCSVKAVRQNGILTSAVLAA